jgi:hypothetical protein
VARIYPLAFFVRARKARKATQTGFFARPIFAFFAKVGLCPILELKATIAERSCNRFSN